MEITFKTSPHKAVSFVESSVKKALDKAGYLICDVKYDGIRGNIVVDNTADSMWLSRVSKTIPALEHLNGFDSRWQRLLKDDRCIFPDGFMLDGELMVKDVDFNTGSGLLRTKWSDPKNFSTNCNPLASDFTKKSAKVPYMLSSDKLKVVLYGVMPFDSMVSGETYEVMNLLMREHVKAMLPLLNEYFPEIKWDISESYEVYDYVELTALYEKARADGQEGLVVKDPLAFYQRGKKSGFWKLKPECEADGIIQSVNWGTPGLSNEGLVIGFNVLLETGRHVAANNISQTLMEELTANVKEHGEDYYNGWACQVAYMEETSDGSLRHPSFVMFRGVESDPMVKM
ncbi:ATP-dependent DNA ligase [Yersinia pestis]|uniref:DNA ligase n=2 Tax=Berlinvirus Yepf TaxID=2732789 RepID=E5L7C2_9CAUD|nr:ATP-dependent DNA ligase [Yersinia pestis]YP_009014827.1 DNA ligase [Yersinia phage Yep-phi]QTI27916.1 ATP-dependent DNA ligase [Yersinia phage vB_YpP-YepMm]ADQ83160.1 DNA ligase [Yersinia phage Yep-phi]MBD3443805.1 ATP-dependent DNA ligase [Yersinia pestis]MBD3447759.1 ATP-dependent DNA ligase [Yersinia pestis]MBD3451715.1 ATP-dependent DNA ligase [Yersinia pestis]